MKANNVLFRGEYPDPDAVRYLYILQNMRTKGLSLCSCYRVTDGRVKAHIKARLKNLRRKPKYYTRSLGFMRESDLDAIGRLRGRSLSADECIDVIRQHGKR